MELSKMSIHELKREITKLENRLSRTTSNYSLAETTFNKIQELEAELEYRRNKHNGFSFR